MSNNKDSSKNGAIGNVQSSRLETWKERSSAEVSDVRFKNFEGAEASNERKEYRVYHDIDSGIDQSERAELQAATMLAATGSTSKEYSNMIFSAVSSILINAQPTHQQPDAAHIANAVNDALISLKPQDAVEGMLCTRLIALHSLYMKFMNQGSVEGIPQAVADAHLNRSVKLMRVYNETLESLNRHRRKGEQKVTVQHVNVTNHGNAIVANNISGGDS
jgi:hypothetical protein